MGQASRAQANLSGPGSGPCVAVRIGRQVSAVMAPPWHTSAVRCPSGLCSLRALRASLARRHHGESGASGRGSWASVCPEKGRPPGQRGSWAMWYFADSRRIPVSSRRQEQGVLSHPHHPVAEEAGEAWAGGWEGPVTGREGDSLVLGMVKHTCVPHSTVWALIAYPHAVTPSCLRVPKSVAALAMAAW